MADPSAGEREGLAPRTKEPSAGEREGLAPRTKEPSAGEREGLTPRTKEPFVPTKPLTVGIDIKSPECYLALGPTRALVRESGVDVDWLPVVTSPPRPAPDGDDRASRHKRHRAAYRAMDLARYARAAGLTIRAPERMPDSTLAGMAMLAAKAHSNDALQGFLDRAFERYWKAQIDLEDRAALQAILGEVGVHELPQDTHGFAALQPSLAAAGILNAPTYLVEGEIFLGRAHLPMIRWILEGRVSPGPI